MWVLRCPWLVWVLDWGLWEGAGEVGVEEQRMAASQVCSSSYSYHAPCFFTSCCTRCVGLLCCRCYLRIVPTPAVAAPMCPLQVLPKLVETAAARKRAEERAAVLAALPKKRSNRLQVGGVDGGVDGGVGVNVGVGVGMGGAGWVGGWVVGVWVLGW
jgi:hypothetical protein